jgi:hypothetical protein
MPISGVNPTPRTTAVYASDPALPRRPQDSLPSRLLSFGRTRLALASSYRLLLSHPAPGSCRRSNVIDIRGLGGPFRFDPRIGASLTRRSRRCVRGVLQHRPLPPTGPFPPPSPPPLLTALFEGFSSTMDPSDSSPVPRQLRLLDFLSRPGIAHATAGQTRSPRFRRVPFLRDVASDPGRATGPRIAAPHMLPSAPLTASAPAT